jgi:acyl carrier protein
MNPSPEVQVLSTLREAFHQIAPEVDFDRLDPGADLREEADLDSVDLVNLIVLIDAELGVDIPEIDYGEISTLENLTRYLVDRAVVEE